MRIRTITFHRAHNHGSVLQAYALQTFLTEYCQRHGINCDYKIIDYFPEVQKKLYSVFKPLTSIKNIVKNLIALIHYPALFRRHERFDSFVKEYLNLTPTYNSTDALKNDPPESDVFISGSDQIWNVRAIDSSNLYFLTFITGSARKISFAASFGPLVIDWEKYNSDLYRKALLSYDNISVREDNSARNVEYLTGKTPEILADPTFLLSREQWSKIENKDFQSSEPYILLYALEPTKRQLNIVNSISKKLKLPVVVLRYNNKNDWFNKYEKRYDAGPREFLSYIKNAALVLTTSFHGTAFSIIYQKPFFVIDGFNDSRINSILDKTGLIDRSISSILDIGNNNPNSINFNHVERFIQQNRFESEQYLLSALGI